MFCSRQIRQYHNEGWQNNYLPIPFITDQSGTHGHMDISTKLLNERIIFLMGPVCIPVSTVLNIKKLKTTIFLIATLIISSCISMHHYHSVFTCCKTTCILISDRGQHCCTCCSTVTIPTIRLKKQTYPHVY